MTFLSTLHLLELSTDNRWQSNILSFWKKKPKQTNPWLLRTGWGGVRWGLFYILPNSSRHWRLICTGSYALPCTALKQATENKHQNTTWRSELYCAIFFLFFWISLETIFLQQACKHYCIWCMHRVNYDMEGEVNIIVQSMWWIFMTRQLGGKKGSIYVLKTVPS